MKNIKYRSIYQSLKKDILDGKYRTNTMIPKSETLAREHNTSAQTVNKAISKLVNEGFIVRRRGSGSYVKDLSSLNKLENNNTSFLQGQSYKHKDGNLQTKVLHFSIENADEQIANKLSILEGDFVYKIIRLRIIDNVPSIIEYTFMPLKLIPALELKHLENSIYNYLQEDLNFKIQSASVNIKGVKPNDFEREHLRLSSEDFLIQVEQIAYLDNSVIFEYSKAYHTTDEFNFQTHIIATN